MAQPEKQNAPAVAAARRANGSKSTGLGGLHSGNSTTGPLSLLLHRLEHVKRYGKGYTARCPAHKDRTASLSLAEGHDGRALVHCFAGCSAHDVVQAVGLDMADLFPERLKPQTEEEKRQAQQWAAQARWKAALGVVAFEASVVLAAANHMLRHEPLPWACVCRLAQAADRIQGAKEVLQ